MARAKKGIRPDGLYQCRRVMPDGKKKSFYGHSKTEAEGKYKEALKKWEEEHPQKGKSNTVTYRQAVAAYRDYITGPTKPVRRGTITSYQKHLGPTSEYFGDALMEDIDAQKVKEYLDILAAEGKAKKTAINARSVISCVFEYWCSYMHGTGNPVRNAHIPKKMPVTERQEPTKEQRQLIEAHPEGCGFWAALFEYTGMRMGEANGLRWKDIDFAAGKITPEQAMPWDKNHPYKEELKTLKAYRSIPILNKFRPMLEEAAKGHDSDDYVLSGEKEPLSQSQYEWRWAIYCRGLGLAVKQEKHSKIKGQPGKIRTYYKWKALVTAHQFRHLYASNLFYAQVPDKVAQKLLGHADISTTRRIYQHLREDEDIKYTDMLNAYIDGQDKIPSGNVGK